MKPVNLDVPHAREREYNGKGGRELHGEICSDKLGVSDEGNDMGYEDKEIGLLAQEVSKPGNRVSGMRGNLIPRPPCTALGLASPPPSLGL